VHGFPKFDTSVPDIYRYEIWKRDFDKNGPANLNMFWLSSDHTGGPPNGAAQVADNDLATGKIVDRISHSPYVAVDLAALRPGADDLDRRAVPVDMVDSGLRVVLDHEDRGLLPDRTSLTAGLATQPPCGPDVPAAQNPAAAPAPTGEVPADKQEVAAKWDTWKAQQPFNGPTGKADSANPAQMNHLSWYEAHNWTVPYPGEDTIVAPADVPGAVIPAAENDG
jgi:hypothetical protein